MRMFKRSDSNLNPTPRPPLQCFGEVESYGFQGALHKVERRFQARSKMAQGHNWLIYRVIDPALEARVRRYASGILLDIGCGTKPYAAMARPSITRHIGIDYPGTRHGGDAVDIWGVAYDLPVGRGRIDCVLCTDVLEHLNEPSQAVAEAFRVLKPGGYAIYTVPLFWHLHEQPHDYYRYTRYGLEHIFRKSGFEIVEIQALSGFAVTFGQALVYYLYRLRKGGRLNPLWWIVPILGHVIQAVALLLNRVDRTADFTVEYLLVARKPDV